MVIGKRLISFILIFSLVLHGGSLEVAFADEAPTKAPAPPSEAKEESPPKTESPTSPPSPPSPENAAQTALPTQESSPTGGESQGTQSTSSGQNPSPTSENSHTPTVGISPTGSGFSSGGGSKKDPDDPANIVTGPFSTNSGKLTNTNSTTIANENNGQIANEIAASTITGQNFADFNTLSGNIFTGNASVGLTIVNKLNSNFTGVGGLVTFDIFGQKNGDVVLTFPGDGSFAAGNPNGSVSSASGALVQNSITGPYSANIGEQKDTSNLSTSSDNSGTVTNDIKVQALTGGNSASFNTLGATIQTGNANAFANIINMVNTNIYAKQWLIGIVNIFGELSGNIVLPGGNVANESANPSTKVENTITGPLSVNQADVKTTSSDSTASTNSAKVINNINVVANTGENDASVNTYGGDVKTGTSNITVNENTVANTNASDDTVWVVIVNNLGNWLGYIVGAPWGALTASSSNIPLAPGNPTTSIKDVTNSYTGPGSDNSSSLDQSVNKTFTNTNEATLINNIDILADTGKNKAQYNTGPGAIETGNAKASLNLLNLVNTNINATKFVAVLVNVFGGFLGSIIPPGRESAPIEISESDASSLGGLSPILISNEVNSNNALVDEPSDSSILTTTIYRPIVSQQQDDELFSQSRVAAVHQSMFKKQNNGANARMLDSTKVLSSSFRRGAFISAQFTKSTVSANEHIMLLADKHEINASWLVLVPIALFIILIRRRYIFGSIREYMSMLMEVIL